MGYSVGSTITFTTHIEHHRFSNQHQWAISISVECTFLLVKMTKDWRRAIDNKQVVGIIFVDLRKAFDLYHTVDY